MVDRTTFRTRIKSRWVKIGKRRRRLLVHTTILLAIGIIFALLTLAQPFANLQWSVSDRLFLPEPSNPSVVIAAIDDATLEKYGRLSEWSRSNHATAIENLSKAQAGVIGFDVLFSETSDPDEDAALAEAIEQAGNVVQPVLGTQGITSNEAEKVFQKFLQPNSTLYPASQRIGHANVLPDK